MSKNIIFIGPSIELPNLINVNYTIHNLYNLKPNTWERKIESIKDSINRSLVDGIILYLPTSFLLQASKKEYSEIFIKLLCELESTKAILIVYEENLYGNFNYYDYEIEEYLSKEELEKRIKSSLVAEKPPYTTEEVDIESSDLFELREKYGYLFSFDTDKLMLALGRLIDYENRKEDISSFIDSIVASNVDIIAFKDKLEIRTRVQSFIFEVTRDIFFSIFIKKDQPLHEEFESFIRIFEKYIQNIENVLINIDIEPSEDGVSFNFKSKNREINFENFNQAIERFGQFMDLCINDPEKAIEIVNKKINNVGDALNLIQDLSKKYKRLLLDIQHQKEKILLFARQEFENGIEEIREKNNLTQLSSLEVVTHSINGKNNSIATFLSRNSYTKEEQEILRIIQEQFDPKSYIETKSNIDKIRIESTPKEEKRSAVTQIKSHLIKAGKKIAGHAGDVFIKVLTTYLENQIK